MADQKPYPPEVTHEEKMKTIDFWRRHAENLRAKNLVSDEGLKWIGMCTDTPDKIGYNGNEGQIRPGDLGKWDLYGILEMSGYFDKAEMLLLADISASQFAQEERRDDMRNGGFDPDDANDVKQFDRLENMSPEELDGEILRLETALAATDSSDNRGDGSFSGNFAQYGE